METETSSRKAIPFFSTRRGRPVRWLAGRFVLTFVGLLLAVLWLPSVARAQSVDALREVGVARMDITPDFPVRLNGYYGRNAEATNAAQRIFAKALAIGSDAEGPAVLITIDNCILPRRVREEVVKRLGKEAKLLPARIALCVSHTHSAPCLTGAAANLFGMDLPAADQEHIERYTRELIEQTVRVARAALRDRRPARVAWGQDQAVFAANRRTAGGPVDHDLPFLVVTEPGGKLRAIFANYACHCTTLGGDFKQICGDWAGYAQEYLEADHPGAIVLTAIGCGADANPAPRGNLELAQRHGREFAAAVEHALRRTQFPLRGKLDCRLKDISLPLEALPTRAEWESLAKQPATPGYHARKNLARLDRGEVLETQIPYWVQEWNFGSDLAMVFLAGEVVVDYALRLKTEFDSSRLWVNAYANDVPGYIPSRRILKEGGYEGGGAMVYYDHPTRFVPAVEDLIVGAVHELTPTEFAADARRAALPSPRSPAESLAALQTRAGLQIELVAAEPLIESPVYIDFGPDGKLWVVEMRDYPLGMDGKWKPGGRVKYLEASHGDGRYDKATIVAEDLPFPTGVMPWRDGALICAAPDILFVERAGAVGTVPGWKKQFTGFFTDNYQARVNGLSYGLDNWVYGANGLLGGVIHGVINGQELDIRGRDFRMHPDSGEFEPAAGLTQQGRVRDDWGNWFGNDNSNPLWSFPLPDHYLRRNPHVLAPAPRVYAATGPDPSRVYPISRLLERFNQPDAANHVTSACGLGLYRDELLGAEYAGNSFTCEPVGNVVYRLQLHEGTNGAVITGTRAPGEEDTDFLASRDNWFRPVQAKTGPDGALYVVDMYRFVVEHPRWISPERLAQLDVRAGADRGRIYRILPKGAKPRPVPNLRKLATPELVAALESPNGTLRDLVQQELVWRGDAAGVPELVKLARESGRAAVRVQALCTLDGLRALPVDALRTALTDADVHVRRQALRLSESFLASSPALQEAVAQRVGDGAVRYQLALSLGAWPEARAGQALGQLAAEGMGDPWLRAAILSSAVPHCAQILPRVLAAAPGTPGRLEMLDQLIATVVGLNQPETLSQVLAAVAPAAGEPPAAWQFKVLRSLLEALAKQKKSFSAYAASATPEARPAVARIQALLEAARNLAADVKATAATREAALSVLGYEPERQAADRQLLAGLLQPDQPLNLQLAALKALGSQAAPEVPGLLLADWKLHSPRLRAGILEVLLDRESHMLRLLEALQSHVIQPGELSAAQQQRLRQHANSTIRQQAAAVFQANTSGRNRAEVLTQYAAATRLPGEPAKGKVTFTKTCVPCHALKGQGFAVGPDLALLAGKPPGDLLLAILDPNAAVEPRFLAYDIEMKDDRSLVGVISAESSTALTLTQPGGNQEKLLRGQITEIRATGTSLMPEGLEQGLSPQDLADLIAYLKTKPAGFGSAPAAQATAARQKFLAAGGGTPSKSVLGSENLNYPSWLGTLPLAHCRQTDGKSRVAWQTATPAAGLAAGGITRFRLPVAMGLISAPAGHFTLSLNGQALVEFGVTLNDQSWSSADGQVNLSYSVMENDAEDSNGVLVIEVANSRLTPGQVARWEVTGSAAESTRWFGIYKL